MTANQAQTNPIADAFLGAVCLGCGHPTLTVQATFEHSDECREAFLLWARRCRQDINPN